MPSAEDSSGRITFHTPEKRKKQRNSNPSNPVTQEKINRVSSLMKTQYPPNVEKQSSTDSKLPNRPIESFKTIGRYKVGEARPIRRRAVIVGVNYIFAPSLKCLNCLIDK